MRFVVSIPPFTDPRTIVDMAVAAERAGWDGVLLWDHLQFIVPLGLDIHDPWTLLAAIAVRTERITIGTAVTPLSRRRPQQVAKQIVTLDHLSGGRVMIGVGLGEPPDADFADFGDVDDPRTRASMLDEALVIVDGLVSGQRVDVDGEHYRVHAQVRPAAVQRPRPPIIVAGTYPHRRPLARALRWDGFIPIGLTELLSPELLARYLAGVERPAGWQLFAPLMPGHSHEEYAALGVAWLIEGAWPTGDWVTDLTTRIHAGPPS